MWYPIAVARDEAAPHAGAADHGTGDHQSVPHSRGSYRRSGNRSNTCREEAAQSNDRVPSVAPQAQRVTPTLEARAIAALHESSATADTDSNDVREG